MKKTVSYAAFGALVAALFTSAFGCELISSIDRSKIDGTGGTGGATGGAGGTGGQPTSTSTGGATSSSSTGGAMPCTDASMCPDPMNECVDRTCDSGFCGQAPKPAGTLAATQTPGDCKKAQCDGSGAVTVVNDDNDLPDDLNDCTDDVCTNGAPSNPFKAEGSACGANNDLFCNDTGQCVGCVTAADCGSDTDCQLRTCAAGVCGLANEPQGKPTSNQIAGDCQIEQCDGNGGTESADDNADVPDDSETCTKDLCANGSPSNPPELVGTVCSEGNGVQCDGKGACVECVLASDCPGTDDECQKRTCAAGVCGVVFTAQGTPILAQTAGDCSVVVCDGSGGTTSQADTTDPQDDNNACTDDACVNGSTTHTDKSDGTSCGPNLTCLAGACTGCAAPSDCPGVDDECKTRTCTTGVCGFDFTANNTPVSAQTPGDCKKKVCDGSGNFVDTADNTDLPADDGLECTTDTCNNGAVVHPPKAVDTACGPGGTSFCDASGQCVQCNAPTQCAGQDTDCQTRTCIGGACGVAFQPQGTVTSNQTLGDCQVNQCDGSGGVMSVPSNGDVPADDGLDCTTEVCNNGSPAHPAKPLDTACGPGGTSFCNASGQCVQCNMPSQCPGSDTECHTRTCVNNTCGVSNAPAGTPTSAQTANDCHKNQCDGNGNIANVVDDTDAPVDDNNQCTTDVCSNGTAVHPPKPLDTSCSQNNGTVCNATGQCVACNAAGQCPGSDTECHTRTCNSNTCGVNNAPSGTPTSAQTPNDCHKNQCDGNGNIVNAVDDTDLPVDDGSQCTDDTCSNGAIVHPPKAPDTSCSQNGGIVCNATGQCVQCNAPAQCPGQDTECQTRTCASNTCGVNNTMAGTPTSSQTLGDCHENQCDGNGNIVNAVKDTDVPVDSNQCTGDVCTSGAPSNPAVAVNTACNQNGGVVCDGLGACVQPPSVASTTPADGAVTVAGPTIVVQFTTAMSPATLAAQPLPGPCAGTVQVSLDNFATCIAIPNAPVMSGGGTIATFTAAPGLLVNRSYKIRVTTGAQSSTGIPMAAQFTQPNGFTTTSPNLCAGSVVISQVYGGGGLAGATYTNDFVELHNRGAAPVSLVGMSLQYGSGGGSTWTSKLNLTGTIPAGGYYLIQLFAPASPVGAPLPTPDQTASIDMASANGKVALVSNTTTLSGACPTANIVDFVGYGSANCFEGAAAVPALSVTLSGQRVQAGCGDVNNNVADFTTALPAPRNSATAASSCACVAQNETSVVNVEADYCDVQSPISLNVAAGASTGLVYGQIFETGVTAAAGASASVRAQLGFGPPTANPQYEAGWQWTNATFNVQSGNNDEYQAQFTAPASGSYRYVYRFSLDQGVSWTYCDKNAAPDFGAGANPGLSFEFADEPVLTVP